MTDSSNWASPSEGVRAPFVVAAMLFAALAVLSPPHVVAQENAWTPIVNPPSDIWDTYTDDAGIPDAALPDEPAIPLDAGLPSRYAGRSTNRSLSAGEDGSSEGARPWLAGVTVPPPTHAPKFQLRSTLRQEFEYLMVEHGFRLLQDPDLRRQLLHDPFFHNWFVSFDGYDLKRWGDGDDFLVNDIAHPMQGAVAGRIYLQNNPKERSLVIGKDPAYWKSRLKAMGWAAGFEVQWKIGPLSELSIGNAGGWSYVPGCGTLPKCVNNPNYPPSTNNTGLSDWIVTPVMGTGWIMIEDVIDKYVVHRVAENHPRYGAALRSGLEPTRSFAGLFAGELPWNNSAWLEKRALRRQTAAIRSAGLEGSWRTNRRSTGFHFVNVSLPGVESGCVGCRQNYQGFGVPYSSRLFEHVYFDSEVNFFPTGAHQGGPSVEGLFGTKLGEQAKRWGVFAKVRPGFIYYQEAWSGGENAKFTDLSRFALDVGGTFELYPTPRSAVRIDIGTTLVRYLLDYPNPRISPIGSIISADYYATQGNLQIGAGYRIRF
jgi:hypothetical protein